MWGYVVTGMGQCHMCVQSSQTCARAHTCTHTERTHTFTQTHTVWTHVQCPNGSLLPTKPWPPAACECGASEAQVLQSGPGCISKESTGIRYRSLGLRSQGSHRALSAQTRPGGRQGSLHLPQRQHGVSCAHATSWFCGPSLTTRLARSPQCPKPCSSFT